MKHAFLFSCLLGLTSCRGTTPAQSVSFDADTPPEASTGDCSISCGASVIDTVRDTRRSACTTANAPNLFNVLPQCAYDVTFLPTDGSPVVCLLKCGAQVIASAPVESAEACQGQDAINNFSFIPRCAYTIVAAAPLEGKGRCVAFCGSEVVNNLEVESREQCGTTAASPAYPSAPTCPNRNIQYVPFVAPDGTGGLCQSFCAGTVKESKITATADQCTTQRAHEIFTNTRCLQGPITLSFIPANP